MHFQFLIEDQSGKILIDSIMQKIIRENDTVTYDSKPFRGIGGFTPKNTIKETKTGKLLNDLATYLRGFNKSLIGIPATIVVVMDNDNRDPADFYKQLEQVAANNHITIDHVFCIAIEEMEAWLLGDEAAILAAYPQARQQVLRSYIQDSVCGTWEVLADAVYSGGSRRMKKECPTFAEKGREKVAWARNIGIHMDLELNKSPSFNYFLAELYHRIASVA